MRENRETSETPVVGCGPPEKKDRITHGHLDACRNLRREPATLGLEHFRQSIG